MHAGSRSPVQEGPARGFRKDRGTEDPEVSVDPCPVRLPKPNVLGGLTITYGSHSSSPKTVKKMIKEDSLGDKNKLYLILCKADRLL